MHRLAPVFIFNPVFLHFFHPPSHTISHFPRQLPPLSSSGVRVGERVCVCVIVCVFSSSSSLSSRSLPSPSSSNRSSFLFVIFFRFRQHFGHRSSLLLYILSCTCVCTFVCVYVGVCISPLLTLFFPVVQCLHFCVCLCVLFVCMCVCVCMYLDWRVDGNFACFSHFVCFINFKICNKFSII